MGANDEGLWFRVWEGYSVGMQSVVHSSFFCFLSKALVSHVRDTFCYVRSLRP